MESSEPTCFIVPGKHDRPPRDIRCVTCERVWLESRKPRAVLASLAGLFVIITVFFHPAQNPLSTFLIALVAGFLLQIVVIIVHELGHALTARALGLEVSAFVIGMGRALWVGEIFKTPVQLHVWPVCGVTAFGAYQVSSVRLRLALATFMGAGANALVIGCTLAFWEPIERYAPPYVAPLWLLLNVFAIASSLFPYSFVLYGRVQRSDGMQLLQAWKQPDTDTLAIARPLLRALAHNHRKDYAAACRAAEEGLARCPNDALLRISLSAFRTYLREYAAALEAVRPFIHKEGGHGLAPYPLAIARNNAAYALAILSSASLSRSPSESGERIAEADRFSREAHAAFPCVLAFIGTRSFVLAISGKAEEALRLLEYPHYSKATNIERGHRAFVQAIALQALGREAEATRAAAEAREWDPERVELFQRFGVVGE